MVGDGIAGVLFRSPIINHADGRQVRTACVGKKGSGLEKIDRIVRRLPSVNIITLSFLFLFSALETTKSHDDQVLLIPPD